ncbi:MAG TPA: hypothetical protein VFX16_26240 [Pseudonocardiaceae bacterium]|nr:hypothetical protein [Pseudonocardiaceae bacterium]
MIWVLVLVALVVICIGALGPVLAWRNKRTDDGKGGGPAIAAQDKYQLLGHYVEDPVATDDEDVAALLRNGRERWNSAGAILAYARSGDDYQMAERVAAEGLADVAAAHAKLGIPGPAL